MYDMKKSALPTKYFLKQNSCPDAEGKKLVSVLFTVLGKAFSVGSHSPINISAQLIRMGRASRSIWRKLSSKTLRGRNLEPLAKAAMKRESSERERERDTHPYRLVVSCINPVLALQNENVPAPCQKCHLAAQWHPLFLAAKALRSSLLKHGSQVALP